MISQLAEILQRINHDPEPEALADALWLALKMHQANPKPLAAASEMDSPEVLPEPLPDTGSDENPGINPDQDSVEQEQSSPAEGTGNLYPGGTGAGASGDPVRSPGAAALPGALELSRSLRPLKRRVQSRREFVFDEQASIRFIAEQRIWTAVLRPLPERWLSINLVIDRGASMIVWQQTIAELRRLLAYHGAFADVRVWLLQTDAPDSEPTLHAAPHSFSQNSSIRQAHPRELLDVSGRRLILIVSDCVSPAWRKGTVAELIQHWGKSSLVSIFQVLPQRLWVGTALGDGVTGAIQTGMKSFRNTQLQFLSALPDSRSPDQAITVPVVTLEPEALGQWAKVLAGNSAAQTLGVRLPLTPEPVSPPVQPHDAAAPSAEGRLRRFRRIASPTARELAGYLAAAPLSLPVMRLVQHVMLPESRQVHLAEVFLGGLLRRVTPADQIKNLNHIQYDFVDDQLRDLLLNTVLVPDAIEVLRQVSAFVESHAGQSLDFEAILENPEGIGAVQISEQALPFARVAAKVLERLGGRYVAAAQQITGSTARSLQQQSEPNHEQLLNTLLKDLYSFLDNKIDILIDWYREFAKIKARIEELHTAYAIEEEALRSVVLVALNELARIYDHIQTYFDSSSRVQKQAAILRASNQLAELDRTVEEQVGLPEQYILRRIIQQWQELVTAEGGLVAESEISQPVLNPYTPARGKQFVGRADLMRRLEELWGSDHARQAPSIVLHGHRRMGKTSILQNLGARFGEQTVIVDFNMQRFGKVTSNQQLLYQLALLMQRAGERRGIQGLRRPAQADFTAEQATFSFNLFLDELDQLRNGLRFIICVDEFEKIEERIAKGDLTPDLLELWRANFVTYPWLIMAFAGLYTLQEMTEDYWNPLFGVVEAIKVSFLSPGAAEQLIVAPSPDFQLDYDDDAVARIIALSHGQPYLVQHICHALVRRFNQQTFEEGREREFRLTLDDVEAVVNAADFDQNASAYFGGIWQQAEQSAPAGQSAILRVLARQGTPPDLAVLAVNAGLTEEQARSALATLIKHDVVAETQGRYAFTVPLMRRWVQRQKVDDDASSTATDHPHAG
jgi:hypothetical protein